MHRPPVTFGSEQAVNELYDYYLDKHPNAFFARIAHWLMPKVLHPNIEFTPGAKQTIDSHLARGRRIVLATNHIHALDPFHIAAALQTEHVLRPMRTKSVVAGRPDLFRTDIKHGLGLQRLALDELGAFPAIRSQDRNYSQSLSELEQENLKNLTLNRFVSTAVKKIIIDRYNLVMFPEGTRNKTDDTDIVQPLKAGLGLIFENIDSSENVALLPAGFSYHNLEDSGSKHPNLYIGALTLHGATDPQEVTRVAQASIQDCLDYAY